MYMASCLSYSNILMKHGVSIRVLGDLNLLPPDVLLSVARAVNTSRNNKQAILNICFSYTSRHEMTAAIRQLAQGAAKEMIYPRSGQVGFSNVPLCISVTHSLIHLQ